MSNTVKIVNSAALQEAGTKALSPNSNIDDIYKLRKCNYHVTQPMTVCEKMEYYNAKGNTGND